MASIGLRKPYIAKYNNNNGIVTYSDGGILAKAIEYSSKIESGDDNNLYADDGVAESDRSFGGGKLEITTDDLEQAASALILGITPTTITVGSDTVTELIYNDDMNVPDLGFGIIIPKKKNGAMKYRAVVLTKVKFNIPEDAASTQGEKIEWKTPKIDGTIMRDDTAKRAWKREATFDSEPKAVAYIEQILNITLGTLSVTSAAGTATGNTKVTVSPAKDSNNSYKYKVAASVTAPSLNESITTGYTAWDGVADITAATGQKILIVEVDSNNLAKKAGITTVTSKA